MQNKQHVALYAAGHWCASIGC